ncbi:MAG: DUF1294 domain-containing protein [Candidatus Thiodiazotropha sp. (ex Notomyrtea botanica)]|nr:DUF1294 domain-containing protein [Candidatus Thiodiazotropha sp. (ex Notomyrtea botanica)]
MIVDHKNVNISKGMVSILSAAIFILIADISVIISTAPLEVFVVYLIAGLNTFVMYARDKSAARKGAWRTKESTLHRLALF